MHATNGSFQQFHTFAHKKIDRKYHAVFQGQFDESNSTSSELDREQHGFKKEVSYRPAETGPGF